MYSLKNITYLLINDYESFTSAIANLVEIERLV